MKLTRHDVQMIRELTAERKQLEKRVKAINSRALAEKFGVSKSMIDSIAANRSWK